MPSIHVPLLSVRRIPSGVSIQARSGALAGCRVSVRTGPFTTPNKDEKQQGRDGHAGVMGGLSSGSSAGIPLQGGRQPGRDSRFLSDCQRQQPLQPGAGGHQHRDYAGILPGPGGPSRSGMDVSVRGC